MRRTLFVFTVVVFGIVSTAAAQSPEGPHTQRWDVGIDLLPDGALLIEERYQVAFEDEPSGGGFRSIPARDLEGPLHNIAVTEGETVYEEAEGKEPGTFHWTVDGPNYLVTWNFLPGEDSTREVNLSYRAENAVRVETDIANRLLWNAIPAEHIDTIDSVEVLVRLPEGTEVDERLRPAAYGTEAEVTVEGREVTFSVDDLPSGEGLRVEVYFQVVDESIIVADEAETESGGGVNISLVGFGLAIVILIGIIILMVTRARKDEIDPV